MFDTGLSVENTFLNVELNLSFLRDADKPITEKHCKWTVVGPSSSNALSYQIRNCWNVLVSSTSRGQRWRETR